MPHTADREELPMGAVPDQEKKHVRTGFTKRNPHAMGTKTLKRKKRSMAKASRRAQR